MIRKKTQSSLVHWQLELEIEWSVQNISSSCIVACTVAYIYIYMYIDLATSLCSSLLCMAGPHLHYLLSLHSLSVFQYQSW